MILERQPPRCNLIETAFNKCEAEVARKKREAAKLIKESSNKWPKHNLKPSRDETIASSNENQLSSDWRSGIQLHDKKFPPDPLKVTKWPMHNLQFDTVSVVEHPLAKITNSNSQPVSASTKTFASALKNSHKMGTKTIQKRVLLGNGGKVADAIEWEPPKLACEGQL